MIKKIKQWIANIKYDWSYLGVLNSPFVGLKLKWYFGEIKHGVPYFLPRKWVKCDIEDAVKSLQELNAENKEFKIEKYGGIAKYYDYYIKSHTKPVPIKCFGWNSCTLGWKTKWRNDDFRFEWAPCYSLVIFGKQLFVCVLPKMDSKDNFGIRQDCYWEAYLTYRNCTDKTKSKEYRLKETIKQYSCTWSNEKTSTNYYEYILKDKYKKLCALG